MGRKLDSYLDERKRKNKETHNAATENKKRNDDGTSSFAQKLAAQRRASQSWEPVSGQSTGTNRNNQSTQRKTTTPTTNKPTAWAESRSKVLKSFGQAAASTTPKRATYGIFTSAPSGTPTPKYRVLHIPKHKDEWGRIEINGWQIPISLRTTDETGKPGYVSFDEALDLFFERTKGMDWENYDPRKYISIPTGGNGTAPQPSIPQTQKPTTHTHSGSTGTFAEGSNPAYEQWAAHNPAMVQAQEARSKTEHKKVDAKNNAEAAVKTGKGLTSASYVDPLALQLLETPTPQLTFRSSAEAQLAIDVLEGERQKLTAPETSYGLVKNPDMGKFASTVELSRKIDEIKPILKRLEEEEKQGLIDSGEYRDGSFFGDAVWNSFNRGYYNAELGKAYTDRNEAAIKTYEDELASDKYKYFPSNWLETGVSFVAEQAGLYANMLSDPMTQATALGSAGTAFVLGHAGPQAVIPEEIISVPAAYWLGAKAGTTAQMYKIEAGLAYKELLDAGVSPETASWIAAGTGVINAGIELAQLDELVKSAKILTNNPGTKNIGANLAKSLYKYGVNVFTNTAEEVAQEGVTIGGVQLGSKIDTGEAKYTDAEVGRRIGDTAKSSALGFGFMSGAGAAIGSTVNRVANIPRAKAEQDLQDAAESVKGDSERLGGMVEYGKSRGEGSKAYDSATRIESKMQNGEEVTTDEVAELIVENSREYTNENIDLFANNEDNLQALVEEGRDIGGKSSKIADRIASKVNKGQEVTRDDIRQLIAANEKVDAAEQSKEQAEVRKATEVVNRKKAGYGEHGMSLFNEENAKVRDPLAIISEMDTPYQAGLMNKKPNTMTFNTPLEKLAFNAGVKDYIAQRKVDKKHKAIVYTEEASTFNWDNAPADITQEEKNLAEYIVKSMGVAGDFSSAEQAYNAFYDPDTGKTTFDAGFGISPELTKKLGNLDYLKKVEKLANERGQSFTFYLAHEIATHRAMDIAPREMRAFVSAMYEYKQGKTIGANLAREKTTNYGLHGKDIDTYTAMEEVVADVILDLYDGDVQAFADAIYRIGNSTNESAKKGMQTYFKWLGDFIEKLKAWVQKLTGRENAALKANVEQSISEIENLRNMFEKAIGTSMKTVAKARAKGKAVSVAPQTTTESNIKESIKGTLNAAGLDAVKDENGRVIVSIGGKQVKSVTAEHIRDNSAMGGLIKQGFYNGFITEQEAETQYEMFADIVNMIINTEDPELVWAWTGSSLFSAVKSNADGQYGTTIDFTTICRKTQDMITAMSKSMMKLKRGLTKAEITELQKELLAEGSSVPCPVCYVFSRWAGVGSILDNMSKWQTKYENFSDEQIQERITLLEEKFKSENRVKGKDLVATLRDLDEEYDQLNSEQESLADEKKRLQPKKRNAVRENDAHTLSEINNRITEIDKRTKQIKDRLKYIKGSVAPELAWLTQVRAAPDYKQHGRVPSNVLFNLNDAATFAEKYPLAWKYRSTRGPSAGKAILPYSDMQLGDIILGVGNTSADGNKLFENANGEFTAEQTAAVNKAIARALVQNLIGGQRFQSTSDFRYDYALDYLMAFLECQAIGAKMQTYTKIIEFGDMVAAVGGDFNLSVMPRNKGYITLPNGTNQLVFSSVTGISYEAAVRSSQMHDNGQLILVGINDAHILAALEDSEETRGAYIGFVIPYHASGASIDEFIRVLVSNLGETYMAKNYMDYSDVQSDAENGKATAAQKRRNDLRTKLLKGKDGAKNWEPTAEDLKFIRGESVDISDRSFEELRAIERKALRGDKAAIAEYESWTRGALWSLYEKLWSNESSEYHGVRLNSAQAKSVMPHEYWNKSVGRDKAYINGFLFRSYCYNLGLSPRFTGVGAKGKPHGDFSDSKGYWKLLIDRPMYNNDGTYRNQQRVNVTKLQKEMLTPSYAKTNWEGYAVQEPSAERASRAADRFVAQKNTTTESGGKKYSFKGINKFGIEVYETSAEVKAMRWKDRKKQFLDIMENEYRGRTAKFVRNGHAYYATFEKTDVEKNIYGDSKSDDAGRDAKINAGADGDIFNLVENSVYDGSGVEKGKKIAAHTNVKYWDYFIKKVQIDGQVFDLLANVRKKPNNNYVYDITLVEDKKTEAAPPDGLHERRPSNGARTASEDMVTQPEDSVKSKSSLKGEKETFDEIIRIREEGAKAGKSTSEIDQEVGAFVGKQYAELIKEYGAFDRGEKASREIEVPKKSDVDRQVSQTVRTILEAEVTPDTLVPQLEEMVATGDFSYDVFTDKAAMAGAKRTIKAKKFPVALAEWINAVESGTVNKANTALGWELYNQAATNGDVDTAITILTHMVGHQRNAAQALQATRILKKLTPDAQLYSAVKAAQKLEDDVNGRKKRRKATRDDDAVTAAEEIGEAKQDTAKEAKKAHKGVRVRKRNGRRRVEVGRDMVGEPFAYEYAQRVGEELAKRLESKNRGNGKQKTFLQQILGELNRFANEKFKTEKQGDALTAIDLLRDYIQNQSFYTEAWEAAQIELRDKYADNPIFNEFINSGIGVDANANPQNAIFMRALVSAAAEIGEGKRVLQRQSALGFTGMADTIANKLIEQTGASGEMADTIRDASYAYVMDAVAETDSDKLVEGAIKSAMKDIGITLSDTVLNGKGESAQQAITDMLIFKYGFSNADATNTVEVVAERFGEMSRKFAEGRLKSMFKERSVVRKTFTERFEQLARLGAFDIGSAYNQRATERLFGVEHPITVNESLAQQFMEAETQEDRDRIMIEIFRDIGSQIPASWVDKFNAWRYMAMLTNPRTHIRNVIGNAAFAPVVLAKDLTASAIESTVNFVAKKTTGKSIGRTKGRVKSDLLKAAWEDFANVQDIVKGGGKYNDTANANRHIEEGRRIYKTKMLEGVRKTNSNLLDLEDMWFSKPHYAYALAQYCSANGITADQLKRGKALGNAREYAIREAQKATYRDTNAFSEMIGNLGRKRNANGAEKALGVVMSGVLPFRKTPANILARGVEYSPVGLLKGLTYDLGMVAKGEKTAAEAIDSISAGLTGTGLIALGVFLAAQGLVRGAGGSDEEEKKFEELQGHQAYSLELPDGTSITLDWLAPEALPFFVGVNLYETMKEGKKGATAADLLSAVTNITDPMLELSCLQSLNDIFDSVGYAQSNDTSALMAVLTSATTSYLTQYVPTLLGQAERSTQDKRMTTYTEKDNWLTSDMQYTLGKTSARIPGWDFQQIPYIDAWGRAESTGNPVANTANNFLNPAYTSKVESSAMEKELARLYDRTGESKVLPQRADKSFTVDGERKDLTATEYVKYAKEKGQLSYEFVTDITESSEYKRLSDEDKADAVSKAYEYANALAKMRVDKEYDPTSWVATAIEANEKVGFDEAEYILFQVAKESLEWEKGKTGAKKKAVKQLLNSFDLDRDEYNYLWREVFDYK